jgi:hypothetical protein
MVAVGESTDRQDTASALIGDVTSDLGTASALRFGWGQVVLYALVLVVLLLVTFLLSTFVPSSNVGAFAAVLSGLAALALAVLTAFLLVLNQRLIAANFRMARATVAEAVATKDEAAASLQVVEEMRADRELTFRPFLSWEVDGAIQASNNGRGPALNAVFCGLRADETWVTTLPRLIDFGPGDHIPSGAYSMLMSELESEPPPRPTVKFPVRKLAFCEDQLGNRYCFIQGSVKPDVWKPAQPKPDWVTWYEANAPIVTAE